MAPSSEDVQSMTDLISAMNSSEERALDGSSPNLSSGLDLETQEMKKILESFEEITNDVSNDIATHSVTNSDTYESIHIDQTNNSIENFGKWTIKINETSIGLKKKTYDVCITEQTIISGLYTYESAYSIAKLLESGLSINHKKCMTILYKDDRYASNWNDAAIFTRKIKESKNNQRKKNLYEVKFENARSNALKYKHELKAEVKNIKGN